MNEDEPTVVSETRTSAVIPVDAPSGTAAPAAQAQDGPRKATRRRVLKSGVIAFNDRFSALPCTVRNLSSTGAQLRVDGTLSVPNTFELLIELDGLEAQCEVVWRRDKEIGVRFASLPRTGPPKRTQSVNPLTSRQASPLRRKPLV
jgi:PilZ domain